jgi:Fe-S cluster assembly ATP-binding protein
VILGGRIVETGGKELAEELHERGYDRIRKQYPEANAENQALLEQGKEKPELAKTSA